ncbi:hypothetical protein F4780DRAFT_534201 [Xylariomycetidae sp. FL0641]|nr:hypothetical protein F4780DRAFT_534201 [Xylariomycetidae sp. FL0641]
MDVAYQQHSNQARRKNRSASNLSNLNHLSLAPLTSKLPLTDPDDLPDVVASPVQYNVSYLSRKSAPTTPRLLRSPARTRGNSPRRRRTSVPETPDTQLPKSKSTTHLVTPRGRHRGAGVISPLPKSRHGELERNDSDWMLRTGSLISSEARESKGQAWLISRESATSLSGLRDAEEEAYERELAREKELLSRHNSRRGSIVAAEEDMLPSNSRYGSRSRSRAGSRSQIRTPLERHALEGYFGHQDISPAIEEHIPGPDFVSLDEKLESIEVDTTQADEATVRRLVNRRSAGMGSWMWSLFAVEENEEDSDNADGEITDGETDSQLPRSASTADFEGFSSMPEERLAPPKAEEGSGWQDAAWLLSVASKVLL